MKKIYFILFFVANSFMQAQYTITSAANPAVGDIEFYKLLDTINIFQGSPGLAQTWNYTGVSIATVATTPSTYVAMTSVPNNFLFPGATIASDVGFGNYQVYSNNATKIEFMGFATATASNCLLYSNPLKLFSLPFSYGSVSPDNFLMSGPGFTVSGTFTTTGDGTGTLMLPSMTFPNVLKQNIIVYQTNNYGTGVDTYTVIESRYYSAASKFPLLVIDSQTITSTTGTVTTTSKYKTGQINANLISGLEETLAESSGLNIYPNPNAGEFLNMNFNLQSTEEVSLGIYDALGQSVKFEPLDNLQMGANSKRIYIDKLPAGIYLIELKAGTEKHIKRLTVTD